MNNIELISKWKYNVNWLNKKDWTSWFSSRLAFETTTEGLSGIFWLGLGGWQISRDFLQKNTKYRIRYKAIKRAGSGLSGKLWIGVSSTLGQHAQQTLSDGVYYEHVISTGNFTVLKLYNINSSDFFGLTEFSIEQISPVSLDLFEDNEIAMNLSVSDVKDIGNRKASYSYDFNLPGTHKNNNFFKYLFNINVDSNYSLTTKVPTTIISNGKELFDGYIELNNIIKNDDKIVYNINFYSNVVDLISAMGDTKLTDLDWSAYNHTATYTHVTNTMTSLQTYGYTYPYIDYGLNTGGFRGYVGSIVDRCPVSETEVSTGIINYYDNVGLSITDLYPAFSVYTIINKMFNHFGFSYSSTTLFEQSWFKDLIVPFTGSVDRLETKRVVASYKPDYTFYCNVVRGVDVGVNGKYNIATYHLNKSGVPCSSNETSTGYKSITKNFDYYGGLNAWDDIRKDKIGVPTLYEGKEYGPQGSTCIIGGCYKVRKKALHSVYMKYKLGMYHRIDSTYVGVENNVNLSFFRINRSVVQGVPDQEFKILDDTNETISTFASHNSTTGWETIGLSNTNNTFTTSDIEEDDMIGVKITKGSNVLACYFTIEYINFVEFGWGRDCVVEGKDFIPQDVTCKDFFSDILTMFNCYVDVNLNNPKNLIIEPRKEYYKLGSTRDWTYKLDKSNDITIQHPKEFQERELKFRYSEASDWCNDVYNNKKDPQDIGYGGKSRIIESDFVDGIKDISLKVFKPSVLRDDWKLKKYSSNTTGTTAFYTSYIEGSYDSDITWELNTDIGPRILTYRLKQFLNNLASPHNIKFRLEGQEALNILGVNFYPYAGHLDFPETQNIARDFNFETAIKDWETDTWQAMFPLLPSGYMTTYNLYNAYWKDYVDEIVDDDARLMTARFTLTDYDIQQLSLKDIIFCDGTYYTINKINDYKLGNTDTTEVELLKRTDISSVDFATGGTLYTDTTSLLIPVLPTRSIILGKDSYSTLTDSPTLIIGDRSVATNGGIVIGDGNTLRGGGAIINSDNVSSEYKSTILNSSNVNVRTTGATIINESNITVTQYGTYISGVKIKDGEISETTIVNKPGQDTVQVDFSNATVNNPGSDFIYKPHYWDSNKVNKPI